MHSENRQIFRYSFSMNYESIFYDFSTEKFSPSNQFVNLDLSVLILSSNLFSIACIGECIRIKISCAQTRVIGLIDQLFLFQQISRIFCVPYNEIHAIRYNVVE